MARRRPANRNRGHSAPRAAGPPRDKPPLPPANPPRKHFAFLLATAITLVAWLAFLVAMALWR